MTNQLTDIDIALAETRATRAAFKRLETALERVREGAVQGWTSTLPPRDAPVTAHRREHRMGRAPKIDRDPELQAFILARLDLLTYEQIAADIAAHFPPERRVHRSTVHLWAQRQRKEQR